MEQRPVYVGYMTRELIEQLEEKIAMLMDNTGYGEIAIVVKAHKIKWIRLTENELIHTPFE